MRLLLGAFFLTAAPLAALGASDPVPRLNVQQSCRDAQAVSIEGERRSTTDQNPSSTYTACMQDEKQAHDQLAQRWRKFSASSRQSCLAQGIRPSPSYVEILTCLEMNADTSTPVRPVDTPAAAPSAGSPKPGSF